MPMPQLPPINTDYMLDFLKGLLNTPSPTGFTEAAIDYTERSLQQFPFLSIRRTRKGALVATWPGQKTDTPRALTAHIDTLGAMLKYKDSIIVRKDSQIKISNRIIETQEEKAQHYVNAITVLESEVKKQRFTKKISQVAILAAIGFIILK